MRIIAYQVGQDNRVVGIKESTGDCVESDNVMKLLGFLVEDYGESLRVCWTLDTTVAPLLKLLGEKHCRTLYETKKLHIPPYSLFYIQSKVFSVKHIPTKLQCNLYGIDQYFQDYPEPEDIEVVYNFGRMLWEELKAMGMRPTKLTSPAAIYEQCVLRFLDKPNVKNANLDNVVGEYAWRCSGKVWVEAHKLGYWEKTYDYDIVSAFPSVVANLYDIRNCEIVHSNKYQENALYGYCKGIVNIYDEVKVSPIIRIDEKGNSSSPTGTWPDYLTKNDMKFIRDWDIGKFEIEDGHWLFAKKLTQPMKNITERLLRHKVNGGLRADIAKSMSVGGLYGKLGEDRVTEFGPHFNPAWFAQVSTEIRIEDAEFIYRNHLQGNVIHISVDGVLSDKKVELKGNGEAGEWRLSQESPALVLSSGLVYLENRMPKGLTLYEILGMFSRHPNTSYYERLLPGRVTLGEALEADRLADVGREVDKRTSIDFLRQHHDREFKKVPMTGRQAVSNHYGSVPYRVRELTSVL